MRVLGIDLGSKRIGVAVSDRTGTIASPLMVIQRSGSTARDHQVIAKLFTIFRISWLITLYYRHNLALIN